MAFKFSKTHSPEKSRGGSIDSNEELLNPTNKDCSMEDTEGEYHDELTTRKLSKSANRSALWRPLLDLLVLVGIGVVMTLVVQRMGTISRPECVQHHLPVGSDLSGFVPSDISSRPTLWTSGPDAYTFSAEVFDNPTAFNKTVASGKTLTNAFVVASPYDGQGRQSPFKAGKDELFVISGLHHLHCLTAIFERFGKLQSGYSRQQLEEEWGGNYFTWGEHISHCFNKVRQALMCHADSTVEGHQEGNEQRITHTGVLHICNDFSALMDWASQPERVLPTTISVSN